MKQSGYVYGRRAVLTLALTFLLALGVSGMALAAANFAPVVNYPVEETPRSITNADFDGDGGADLATTNERTGNVSVLLNNGDGTFAAPQNYPVGLLPFQSLTQTSTAMAKPISLPLTIAPKMFRYSSKMATVPLGRPRITQQEAQVG